ncbi:MAG: hypothetical protein NC253_06360 [Ruminococcus sp.]|nr:hypothetical protein [Ruminococcus sp.]MCM1380787.1 hypothetical protein [Muribaculaceae bacterium]MCM1478480.1 hypothetical protein [Muribaculaceae bacterium]
MPENNNSIERAEQRVREMDRVTRQFSERGNRYMRDMQNRTGNGVPNGNKNVHNAPYAGRGSTGTRFEPIERKKDAAEEKILPKNSEKKAAQNVQKNGAGGGARNVPQTGIDGEKLLLMALLYLLMTENADIKLILAIGYLIL